MKQRQTKKKTTYKKGTLTQDIPNIPKEKQETFKNLQFMQAKVQEDLKSYVIVGYTFDGIPVALLHAKTQEELDALNHSLHRFIMQNSIELPPGKQSQDSELTDPPHDPQDSEPI